MGSGSSKPGIAETCVFLVEGNFNSLFIPSAAVYADKPVYDQLRVNDGLPEKDVFMLYADNQWVIKSSDESIASTEGPSEGSCPADGSKILSFESRSPIGFVKHLKSPVYADCLPQPATIVSAEVPKNIGSFKSLYDCSVKARAKYPNAVAISREPLGSWFNTGKCSAYLGPVNLQPPPPTTTANIPLACILRRPTFPGKFISKTPFMALGTSPTLEACTQTAVAHRKTFHGVSWRPEGGFECEAYVDIYSVDSGLRDSGWRSVFIPPGASDYITPTDPIAPIDTPTETPDQQNENPGPKSEPGNNHFTIAMAGMGAVVAICAVAAGGVVACRKRGQPEDATDGDIAEVMDDEAPAEHWGT